jgi:Gas vesicle synthesis protein GvpL/GvpF
MTPGKPEGAVADQSVVYVYGVARAPHGRQSAPPRLEGIVPAAPVRRLVHANLMAFVSAVPAAQFGPSEFRSAMNDAAWLKDRILAHEKVVEELRSSYDVVPFRFGTIYLNTSQASNALARHRRELRQALDRVRDASEWGVKLYCDQDTLRREIETNSDSIRQLRDMLGLASPGVRFFLQKKYAKALDGETAVTIASAMGRIRQSLDSCACESTEIEVQPAAVHGRSADMVMNAAYLVAAGSLGPFRQMFAALQEEFAAHGFDYELTGPWPPYHFVSVRQEGIADAATSDQ